MITKKISAERVCFGGGETAIIFPKGDSAFGTLIDEYDNIIAPVFVIFDGSGQRSSEVQLVRFGASDSREYNTIISRTPVEVRVREASYIIPQSIVNMTAGVWKFGGKFFRTCYQFLYGY